jgi:predicted nuclease of predicted toxin-antitoxin system
MRFYLDEHMPLEEITHRLRRKGHSHKHAVTFGFGGRDDSFHYQFARSDKRILITQDADFADPRRYPYRGHPGVIILDISRDADPLTLFEILEKVLRLFSTAASLYESKVIAHATHCARLTEQGQEEIPYLPA